MREAPKGDLPHPSDEHINRLIAKVRSRGRAPVPGVETPVRLHQDPVSWTGKEPGAGVQPVRPRQSVSGPKAADGATGGVHQRPGEGSENAAKPPEQRGNQLPQVKIRLKPPSQGVVQMFLRTSVVDGLALLELACVSGNVVCAVPTDEGKEPNQDTYVRMGRDAEALLDISQPAGRSVPVQSRPNQRSIPAPKSRPSSQQRPKGVCLPTRLILMEGR